MSYGIYNNQIYGYGVQQYGCYQNCCTCQCNPCQCTKLCSGCRFNPCQCVKSCHICEFNPCRCVKSCHVCEFNPCRCVKSCHVCGFNPCRCVKSCHVCGFNPCRCVKSCHVCGFNPCRCVKSCHVCGFNPCRCVKSCHVCGFNPCRCRSECESGCRCNVCVKKINYIICWHIEDPCCRKKAEKIAKSTVFKLDKLWQCNTICRREYVIRYGIFLNAIQKINHELKCFSFNRKCCEVILEALCELSEYILQSKCIDIFIVCKIIKRFKKALECCREIVHEKKCDSPCEKRKKHYEKRW